MKDLRRLNYRQLILIRENTSLEETREAIALEMHFRELGIDLAFLEVSDEIFE